MSAGTDNTWRSGSKRWNFGNRALVIKWRTGGYPLLSVGVEAR